MNKIFANTIAAFLIMLFCFFISAISMAEIRNPVTDNISVRDIDGDFFVSDRSDINGDGFEDVLAGSINRGKIILLLGNNDEEEIELNPANADFIIGNKRQNLELGIVDFFFIADENDDGLNDILILYDNDIEGVVLSTEITDRVGDNNVTPKIPVRISDTSGITKNPLSYTDFYGIWGPDKKYSSLIYLVGRTSTTQGVIYQYNGTSLTNVTPYPMGPMNAVWGNKTGEHVWFAGSGLHYHGPWAYPDWAPLHGAGWHADAWGISENNVYIPRENLLINNYVRSSNQYYISYFEYPLDCYASKYYHSPELEGVWGFSANDVFVVGEAGDYYFNNYTWSHEKEPPMILHWNGKDWEQMYNDSESDLYGVWGTAHNNVYAVGREGTILHYDGIDWTAVPTGSKADFMDVWGSSANDIFVAGGEPTYPGSEGVIYHYDGKTWSKMNIGNVPFLTDVWGRSATDVYAVGFGGTFLHYNGKTWTKL